MARGVIYSAKSASAVIETGNGELIGIFVSSSSSGTLKAWDNVAASGTVIFDTTDTITAPCFLACPANFSNGLFVTIGGTVKYTVCYSR